MKDEVVTFRVTIRRNPDKVTDEELEELVERVFKLNGDVSGFVISRIDLIA